MWRELVSSVVSSSSSSSSTIGTCDTCGWIAAFGGMLAFGSFGAPIKSKAAQSVDIDPLVMQTYKTSMCFLTCWLILLTGEESFTFTPWGIISGLFWVPGGVATIFAIKNAGLAIGIGVGSSFIVLVSFTWGIFIFHEHVHSISGACVAVTCMMIGLLGMAYYSAGDTAATEGGERRRTSSRGGVNNNDDNCNDDDDMDDPIVSSIGAVGDYHNLRGSSDDEEEENDTLVISNNDGITSTTLETNSDEHAHIIEDAEDQGEHTAVLPDDEPIVPTGIDDDDDDDDDDHHRHYDTSSSSSYMVVCGIKCQRRTLGILSAMFCGIYGGSIMVPMQYAPVQDKGLGYLISFSIGAAIINLLLWILRFLYILCFDQHVNKSMIRAYHALPSFHFQKMWLPGGTAGLLWSIGNFFSLLSVEFLGEGVGYSVVQASILVSGLWGIFYFHEVQGAERIAKWLLSATLTVFGILLLSYEHHEK